MELEKDDNGIITFMALVEWGVNVVEGKRVGLALDYYASPEDAAAKRRSRLQIYLDPKAAREMAEGLTSRADKISSDGGPGGRILRDWGAQGQPR